MNRLNIFNMKFTISIVNITKEEVNKFLEKYKLKIDFRANDRKKKCKSLIKKSNFYI